MYPSPQWQFIWWYHNWQFSLSSGRTWRHKENHWILEISQTQLDNLNWTKNSMLLSWLAMRLQQYPRSLQSSREPLGEEELVFKTLPYTRWFQHSTKVTRWHKENCILISAHQTRFNGATRLSIETEGDFFKYLSLVFPGLSTKENPKTSLVCLMVPRFGSSLKIILSGQCQKLKRILGHHSRHFLAINKHRILLKLSRNYERASKPLEAAWASSWIFCLAIFLTSRKTLVKSAMSKVNDSTMVWRSWKNGNKLNRM